MLIDHHEINISRNIWVYIDFSFDWIKNNQLSFPFVKWIKPRINTHQQLLRCPIYYPIYLDIKFHIYINSQTFLVTSKFRCTSSYKNTRTFLFLFVTREIELIGIYASSHPTYATWAKAHEQELFTLNLSRNKQKIYSMYGKWYSNSSNLAFKISGQKPWRKIAEL